MTRPEVLALIPARGGSKSVPRKNVLPIGGKPLIAHSIGHGLGCNLVTRTIVSTDDEEIASVAAEYGAELPFRRPAEFATDTATDLDVFAHALRWLNEFEGYRPELVVHLRPTTPVRRIELVERAIAAMLADPAADALRSVNLAEQTPFKMWKIEDGELRPLLTIPGRPEAHSMPRQELPEVFWQNGYVDIVRPRTVLELGSMCGNKILPFVVEEAIADLDYPDQIPELERAVARFATNPQAEVRCKRHPA